jgi:hypothetical protein
MKRIGLLLAATALAVSLAGVASAHPYNGIDRREANQRMRIRQGVRHGDLTWREARRLRAGQRRIHRVERRRWADGRLSLRERARLHRMLDRQSHRIYRLRHNGRSC